MKKNKKIIENNMYLSELLNEYDKEPTEKNANELLFTIQAHKQQALDLGYELSAELVDESIDKFWTLVISKYYSYNREIELVEHKSLSKVMDLFYKHESKIEKYKN